MKRGIHSQKRMLSLFFDSKGIIFWRLLPKGTTVDADVYCDLLDGANRAMAKNRKGRTEVYLLQDNASPHTANKSLRKIDSFGWTRLLHPPYSPDMNPCDYGINRAIEDDAEGTEFRSDQEISSFLEQCFGKRSEIFYMRQFNQLLARWQKVREMCGDYFNEKAL
jgi:[histone H3]-lysine36 N-dimethyltransferase SETMAR